jgi:hypothetical protein
LDDAPQLLFQELEDAVTQILLQDSFPKFLGSEQFKQYVEHTRKEEAAKQNLEIVATSSKKPNKKGKLCHIEMQFTIYHYSCYFCIPGQTEDPKIFFVIIAFESDVTDIINAY